MTQIKIDQSIRDIVENEGRTLSEIAKGAQMSISTLHSWSTGIKPKSFEHLLNLSQSLGISCDELLTGKTEVHYTKSLASPKPLRYEVLVTQLS